MTKHQMRVHRAAMARFDEWVKWAPEMTVDKALTYKAGGKLGSALVRACAAAARAEKRRKK